MEVVIVLERYLIEVIVIGSILIHHWPADLVHGWFTMTLTTSTVPRRSMGTPCLCQRRKTMHEATTYAEK